jgi:hypothetical protein
MAKKAASAILLMSFIDSPLHCRLEQTVFG